MKVHHISIGGSSGHLRGVHAQAAYIELFDVWTNEGGVEEDANCAADGQFAGKAKAVFANGQLSGESRAGFSGKSGQKIRKLYKQELLIFYLTQSAT